MRAEVDPTAARVRAVPMAAACDELVDLIKEHGRWVDPPADEEEGGVVGKELEEGGGRPLICVVP